MSSRGSCSNLHRDRRGAFGGGRLGRLAYLQLALEELPRSVVCGPTVGVPERDVCESGEQLAQRLLQRVDPLLCGGDGVPQQGHICWLIHARDATGRRAQRGTPNRTPSSGTPRGYARRTARRERVPDC
jgi:hypothetical protein